MATDLSFKDFLLEEQILFLTSHRTLTLVGHFCMVGITTIFLLNYFPPERVLVWSVAMASIAIAAYFALVVPNKTLNTKAKRRWLVIRNALAFSVGACWASFMLFFFVPNEATYLILLCCLFTGFISAGISVLYAHVAMYISFATGLTLPFAGRLIYTQGYEHLFIGITVFVYVAVLIYTTFNIQTLFFRSTRNKYDNLQLIAQLSEEKDVAIKATAAKNEFLAAASHDLRQPIHAANLFLDVLHPLQSNEKNQQTLDKVRQAMQGLNKMLHGLLDISKLDANAVEVVPQHFALHSAVAKLVDEQTGVAAEVELFNNVDQDVHLYTDPVLVERVLRNLIDNAAKYTHRGSITLSTEVASGQVDVVIEDTGIGIPHDKINTIFDEFTQLNNPERNRQKGLGLGLAIVKRLCKLASYTIEFTSTPNRGTRVSVSIPQGTSRLADLGDVAHTDLAGTNVLVIDDEQDILEGMDSLLEQWGCQVVVAPSLLEAQNKLKACEFVPDVLLADFRLNNHESGVEAINYFRGQLGPQLSAVLITGDTAPERVSLAKQSGAEVVYKPLDGITLKAAIQASFNHESVTATTNPDHSQL